MKKRKRLPTPEIEREHHLDSVSRDRGKMGSRSPVNEDDQTGKGLGSATGSEPRRKARGPFHTATAGR